MKEYICVACDKKITHAEWVGAGALKRHVFFAFDDGNSNNESETDSLLYYCSQHCFVAALIDEHLAFGMSEMECEAHLIGSHGLKLNENTEVTPE